MKKKAAEKEILAVLSLRNIVIFPSMIVPLFVGRSKSIKALENVMLNDEYIMFVTQKDGEVDDPKSEDLYTVGTVGKVLQMLRLPDGTVKALIEGHERAKITSFVEEEPFFKGEIVLECIVDSDNPDTPLLLKTVQNEFEEYSKIQTKITSEDKKNVKTIEDPVLLVNMIASLLDNRVEDKQKLLEHDTVFECLQLILAYMESEADILQVEKRIRGRVKHQMEKTQREYYLNEQMKAIEKELGGSEMSGDGLKELAAQIEKINFTKEAKEKADSELKKLRTMSPMAAEATVIRNYLDWLVAVPWDKKSRIKKDIQKAEKLLNEEHYGLEKIKERIVEYLAVQKRTNKLKGPILCIVGPPGVGKTSLCKSLARATGREFVRISLGGVRDESEIRGHRRTYIGSMPGKIIHAMKKVQTKNPLILLDEIDKLGMDHRGDPSSALLEVLDPEQNDKFSDHYLEVEYDLSDVMFVTTANTLNIQGPLLDRMELIRIAGYTEDEKIEIAQQHLLPKLIENHGLKKGEFHLEDNGLEKVIRHYTREAGVRNLERELSNLCRKVVTKIVKNKKKVPPINGKNLHDYLGVSRYRYGLAEENDQIGVVTGLAWTSVGGELLSIEGVILPGKGKMTTTGTLGDVMKESIGAASSYVRSRSAALGIEPPFFNKRDIHVHVPEGATPKDGPSAGIAMATAIISLMTGIPVRKDIAMTGEVTLRGQALPIGGLKEKLLAAFRGGIKKVLIPYENKKDLVDIPKNIKKGLEIVPVKTMDEVLTHALIHQPSAIEWDQITYEEKKPDGVILEQSH